MLEVVEHEQQTPPLETPLELDNVLQRERVRNRGRHEGRISER